MAQWLGAQGQVNVAKKKRTCGVPPIKLPNKNEKFFFCFRLQERLAESAEGSLAQSPGEL